MDMALDNLHGKTDYFKKLFFAQLQVCFVCGISKECNLNTFLFDVFVYTYKKTTYKDNSPIRYQ